MNLTYPIRHISIPAPFGVGKLDDWCGAPHDTARDYHAGQCKPVSMHIAAQQLPDLKYEMRRPMEFGLQSYTPTLTVHVIKSEPRILR